MTHRHEWTIALAEQQVEALTIYEYVAVCTGCYKQEKLKPELVETVFKMGGIDANRGS